MDYVYNGLSRSQHYVHTTDMGAHQNMYTSDYNHFLINDCGTGARSRDKWKSGRWITAIYSTGDKSSTNRRWRDKIQSSISIVLVITFDPGVTILPYPAILEITLCLPRKWICRLDGWLSNVLFCLPTNWRHETESEHSDTNEEIAWGQSTF